MSATPVVPRTLLDRIDSMDGLAFEDVVGQLFRRKGFSVRKTEYFDFGADLIATKDATSVAIQVKRHGQRVSEDAVRAAHAGKAYYGCNKAMVVTNHRFTRRAVALARATDVELWDRMKLVRQIQWYCALCGESVTAAERRWCLMKHRVFHGNVYCREHQRDVLSRASTSSAGSASGETQSFA